MEKFEEYLEKHGIKSSKQRLLIFDHLFKNHNHPTADNIYTALSQTMPNLSKTTVYNTLNLFVSKGIARIVNIEEKEARFDADTSTHGHFKCKNCGGLFDVMLLGELPISGFDQFNIEEFQINLKGYCKICSNPKV